MKMILIGHRGVGKTSLLQRLLIYHSAQGNIVPVFDLDREIEKASGQKVSEIFDLLGEEAFRQKEIDALSNIMNGEHFIVAVGAGFPLDRIQIPEDVEVVWVRRKTDQAGRIFLDRPRLNPKTDPMNEFQERYHTREKVYQKFSSWVYDLSEGQMSPSDFEQALFLNKLEEVGGCCTVTADHLINLQSFKKRELKWDFDLFELRDDFLSTTEVESLLDLLDKNKTLLSFRKQKYSELFKKLFLSGYRCDWALELGDCPFGATEFLSVHLRLPEEKIEQAIRRLESKSKAGQHLKLAVPIQNFQELRAALAWQGENPSKRSFLPSSPNGRWNWVRLWLKDRQLLNFVRTRVIEYLDQPTLFEWLSCHSRPDEFAAVLGCPVTHSYSPSEHAQFFNFYQVPFYAIEVQEKEWTSAIQLLDKMGLRCAAVTAPLKKRAYEFSDLKSPLAQSFGATNTLLKTKGKWTCENTDFEGVQSLISGIEDFGDTIIWGGGGTLSIIQRLLPKSVLYSARTGKPREGQREVIPQTIIWAAYPDASMPPTHWTPQVVIDLNYRDDSRAKEYCQITGAKYLSGLVMFKTQAQAQRNFWGKRYVGQ